MIDYDLENSPLQIRTNSEVGSNEKVRMTFLTAAYNSVGELWLTFGSPPQYTLTRCTGDINFPIDLPSETDKVWTISLTRNSGEIRVVVHCNNKEVVNVVLSDTVCTSFDQWNTYWSRDVEVMWFASQDTASDYYRAGKH